jgi:hypothetical protein
LKFKHLLKAPFRKQAYAYASSYQHASSFVSLIIVIVVEHMDKNWQYTILNTYNI